MGGNFPHYKSCKYPLPASLPVSIGWVLAGKQQRRAYERLPDDYLLLLTCSLAHLIISAEEPEFIPGFAFVFESRQADIFRQRACSDKKNNIQESSMPVKLLWYGDEALYIGIFALFKIMWQNTHTLLSYLIVFFTVIMLWLQQCNPSIFLLVSSEWMNLIWTVSWCPEMLSNQRAAALT